MSEDENQDGKDRALRVNVGDHIEVSDSITVESGEKHQNGGQERGVLEGEKAPEKGPPHLTDVWCLEMVPEPKVRRDVDGGTL
jgi:hypothetical protein